MTVGTSKRRSFKVQFVLKPDNLAYENISGDGKNANFNKISNSVAELRIIYRRRTGENFNVYTDQHGIFQNRNEEYR